MEKLKGKVAIITDPSSGMGASHARRFVEEGAKVVITDINEIAGHELQAEMGSENALFLKHDVTKLRVQFEKKIRCSLHFYNRSNE